MDGDLDYYNANEAKLNDAMKKGMVLAPPSCTGRVGIVNQGATCYLNSLIQCLFFNERFRTTILKCTVTNSPILRALQKLFVSLLLSRSAAVSTEDLISSFGWTKSQVFEQQDIHELFSVLLDSLGRIAPELNDELQRIFQGVVTDSLVCPSCGHKRDCPSTFLDISLELPYTQSTDETALTEDAIEIGNRMKLTELFAEHMKPEVLDEDNKWECSGCKEKVRATKQLQYKKLPPSLMVHLKRIRFDQGATRKRKITTPVVFHEMLDISPLVGDTDGSQYRLHSVLVHTGTAHGGHYRAYVRDAYSDTWLDCNDAVVCELKENEIAALFWRDAPPGSRPMSACSEKSSAAFKLDTLYENAYMLRYEKISEGAGVGKPALSPTSIANLNDEVQRLSDIAEMGVPEDIVSDVRNANDGLVELQRLFQIHQNILKFKVYLKNAGDVAVLSETQTPLVVSALQSDSYSSLLIRVYNSFVSSHQLTQQTGLVVPDDSGRLPADFLAKCRLRVFNESRNQGGETYAGKEDMTLSSLGFSAGKGFARSMLLEIRSDSEPAFVEFNPKEMQLRVVVWNSTIQNAISSGESVEAACATSSVYVIVPGEDASSVGALRAEAAKVVNASPDKVILIISNDRFTAELTHDDDAKTLRKGFGLWPGDIVFVEVKPDNCDGSTASRALEILKSSQQSIQVLFNDPRIDSTSSAEVVGEGFDASLYKFSVTVSTSSTLADVKNLMAGVLGIADLESFYVRRSAAPSAPQLKDCSKTMHDLGISNQSVLFLQLGKGCQPGEHVLRFDLDVSSDIFLSGVVSSAGDAEGDAEEAGIAAAGKSNKENELISLGDVIVKEKLTVLQLKEQLLQCWRELSTTASTLAISSIPTQLPVPASVHHIRLRDTKGSGIGGPLRNDRILSRCLIGLTDGRRILVQVLTEPEIIGPDDLVLSLRLATFSNGTAGSHPYAAKRLYRPMDFPMTRSSTVQDLYTAVLKKFPHLQEEAPVSSESDASIENVKIAEAKYFAIAKGFTTGPQLTLKAALKLKWNDPAVVGAPESLLDRPPLNLRDGSLIVVRGVADFERAREIAKQRKQAEEVEGNSRGMRPGTASGSAFAAARERARTAGRARRAAPGSEDMVVVKEKGLRINVIGPTPTPVTQSDTGISIVSDSLFDGEDGLKDAPRPPQFSLEDSADSLPSAPLKPVKGT